jgi:hypothetical protein
MQRRILKNLYSFFLSTFIFSTAAFAQESSFRLQQADSLFKAKQYTQALELYRTMFTQNQYTPAMLLKMAFIEEGLAETGQALYHLNLYFNVTHDKVALEKMEELAGKYGLTGYAIEESMILTYFHDYHQYVSMGLAALILLLFALGIFLRLKQSSPIGPIIAAFIFMIPLALNVNIAGRISTGIIAEPQTYVMEGPSSGAPVVSVLNDGHRVMIIGKEDVWLHILLGGKTFYVKQGNILPVTL